MKIPIFICIGLVCICQAESRKKKTKGDFNFDALLSGLDMSEQKIFKEELVKEVKKFHVPSKEPAKEPSKDHSRLKANKIEDASKRKKIKSPKPKTLPGVCDPICSHQCVHGCDFRCCIPGYQQQKNLPRPPIGYSLPGACSPTCSPTCFPQCSEKCCSGGPGGMFQSSLDMKYAYKNECPNGCSSSCYPNCGQACCSSQNNYQYQMSQYQSYAPQLLMRPPIISQPMYSQQQLPQLLQQPQPVSIFPLPPQPQTVPLPPHPPPPQPLPAALLPPSSLFPSIQTMVPLSSHQINQQPIIQPQAIPNNFLPLLQSPVLLPPPPPPPLSPPPLPLPPPPPALPITYPSPPDLLLPQVPKMYQCGASCPSFCAPRCLPDCCFSNPTNIMTKEKIQNKINLAKKLSDLPQFAKEPSTNDVSFGLLTKKYITPPTAKCSSGCPDACAPKCSSICCDVSTSFFPPSIDQQLPVRTLSTKDDTADAAITFVNNKPQVKEHVVCPRDCHDSCLPDCSDTCCSTKPELDDPLDQQLSEELSIKVASSETIQHVDDKKSKIASQLAMLRRKRSINKYPDWYIKKYPLKALSLYFNKYYP